VGLPLVHESGAENLDGRPAAVAGMTEEMTTDSGVVQAQA
jgi:hypothetical protein